MLPPPLFPSSTPFFPSITSCNRCEQGKRGRGNTAANRYGNMIASWRKLLNCFPTQRTCFCCLQCKADTELRNCGVMNHTTLMKWAPIGWYLYSQLSSFGLKSDSTKGNYQVNCCIPKLTYIKGVQYSTAAIIYTMKTQPPQKSFLLYRQKWLITKHKIVLKDH